MPSPPQGNINLIQAAMKKGVKKFVFVTSLGCGSSRNAISEQVGTCVVFDRGLFVAFGALCL